MRLCLCLLIALQTLGCASLWSKKPSKPPVVQEPGEITLRWNGQPDLAGFNIYRRTENGTDVKVNTSPVRPLVQHPGNRGLIPYQFVDRGVVTGEEYYYTFEQIEKNGATYRWETPRLMTASPLARPSTSG